MLPDSIRRVLLVIALLLFIPVAILQIRIDPQRHQFEPREAHNNDVISQLPIEFALGALTGFREAVAGLLWVRADEFFDKGDYQAITPMVRIVTWLDPHYIDVYETGSWHMDYNFTDDGQRSDRRYIPLALALEKEGIANNDDVPDLYADLGFTHYFRKIGDFGKATEVLQQGQALIDSVRAKREAHPNDPATQVQTLMSLQSVTNTSHTLAHCYIATGHLDEALKEWRYCQTSHEYNIKNQVGSSVGEQMSKNVATKQIYELTQRRKWRAIMTKPPYDIGFDAQIVRVSPRVIRFQGTLNAIGAQKFDLETGKTTWQRQDGCRVRVRLEDEGYKMPSIPTFGLDALGKMPDITIMEESISVTHGQFHKDIDMSKNPDIYPFKADKYTATVWFNPANVLDCPENVKDRLGWLGEGMTNTGGKYLDLSGQLPGDVQSTIPGLRYVKKTFTLTRDDLLGQGQKVFAN